MGTMKALSVSSKSAKEADVLSADPAPAKAADATAADARTDKVFQLSSAHGQELAERFNAASDISKGYWIIALVLLVFGVWAGLMPLSSAAIAPGVVGVEGSKKTIQHLEGGIVKSIFVKNGDLVTRGQTLVQLSDVRSRSQYESLRIRASQAQAALLRWNAEQRNDAQLKSEEWLVKYGSSPQALAALETQKEVLRTRRAVFDEKLVSLKHQIAQANEKISGGRARVATLQKQKRVIDAELTAYIRLKEDGMVTRRQLFELKEKQSDIDVDLDDSRSAVAVAQKLLAQHGSQIAELNGTRVQESAENIDRLRDEIARLEQELTAAENQLERVDIKSPIAGFAVNSVVHTTGGVIAPGQTIMEIIPTDQPLIIDVKVEPKDRDSVRNGQKADVRFTAFSQRSTLPVAGQVKIISADRLIDAVTNLPYYQTSIELTEDPADKLGIARLHPGMQAEAVITTGDRTLLSYLLTPFTRSFNRAMREE